MLSLCGRCTPHCAQTTIGSGSGTPLGGLGAERCARFFQAHQIPATRAMSRRYFIMDGPDFIDANSGKQHLPSEGLRPTMPAPRIQFGTYCVPVPDQRTSINHRVILQQNEGAHKKKQHSCSISTPGQRRKEHVNRIRMQHWKAQAGKLDELSRAALRPHCCRRTLTMSPSTRRPPPGHGQLNRPVTDSGRLFLSARSCSRPGPRRRR